MKFYKKNASLIAIIIFFVILTTGFIIFNKELGHWMIDSFGLVGLALITILMDTLIQPFPPDILVFGYALLDNAFLVPALVGGSASVVAGFLGYCIGYFLGEKGIDSVVGRERYSKIRNLFGKNGFWAVAIGALSPMPFSAICWSAGIFRMPFKFFFISVISTRLPRFILVGYISTLFV